MKYLLLFTFILFFSAPANSQDSIAKPGVLNFFLDCRQCDFNYIRDELPFVSFVREPLMADVHILVSDSHTASGGQKFFLNFIGLKSLKDTNHEYELISSQSDTDDDTRKAQVKILKLGILAYYANTPFINDLNIDIEESADRKADNLVIDRWNNWIFRLSTGAEFQKEQKQNEYSISAEAGIQKTTEKWKTEIEAFYGTDRENYNDDGEWIHNIQDSKEVEAGLVKSLNEKWSAGIFTGYTSRTFLNIRHNFIAAPGIQYNFFPWKECNRRVFAIGYMIGMDSYQYIDSTIYDKMHEAHLAEQLMLELEFVQPWGEVSFGLEGRHYFNDFSKNRLTMEADFSVRLTRNISVYCDIESTLIHDQLYLPKGDASLEDILLRRRKLATTYEIGGHFGLRFTFGSIFNNVVNERFNMNGQ